MKPFKIDLLSDTSIISDTNVVKVIDESGIKIYENLADALKSINPVKNLNPKESLEFINKISPDFQGTDKSIATIKAIISKWLNS